MRKLLFLLSSILLVSCGLGGPRVEHVESITIMGITKETDKDIQFIFDGGRIDVVNYKDDTLSLMKYMPTGQESYYAGEFEDFKLRGEETEAGFRLKIDMGMMVMPVDFTFREDGE